MRLYKIVPLAKLVGHQINNDIYQFNVVMNRSTGVLHPDFVFKFLTWKYQNENGYFVNRALNLIICEGVEHDLIINIISQYNELFTISLFEFSGLSNISLDVFSDSEASSPEDYFNDVVESGWFNEK